MLGKIAYLHTISVVQWRAHVKRSPGGMVPAGIRLETPVLSKKKFYLRVKFYVNTLFYLTFIIILHINPKNVRKVISNA